MMRASLRYFCVLFLPFAACGGDGPAFVDAPPPPIDSPAVDSPAVDDPPGPVTSFAAANTGGVMALSWVNPTDDDLAGVLVVAGQRGEVTFEPTDGTSYTVGNAVATDEVVIVASLTTTLADVPFVPGADIEFAAWAYDDAGQYSPIALTAGRNDALGTQQGQIQLFQDGTVVVTQQPRHLRLSGSVIYDDLTDTMTATLRAQNHTARIVFNLKGLVDTTSQGVVGNETFPRVGGLPMAYYGPQGLLPSASSTDVLQLSGIDGTVNPVVLDVHFVDAPSLVVQGRDGVVEGGGNERGFAVVDSSGSGRRATVRLPTQFCGRAEGRGAAITPDGRWAFTGAKSIARVNRLDLPTLTVTQSPDLETSNAVASVGGVALSADGSRVYVTLQDGVHYRGGSGTGGSCGGGGKLRGGGGGHGRNAAAVPSFDMGMFGSFALDGRGVIYGVPISRLYLVELDAISLAELRRLDLGPEPNRSKVAIAGGRAVVMNNPSGPGNDVHVVDLATWTEVDTDAGTPDVQPIALAEDYFETIGVSADGARFAIPTRSATGSYDLHDFDTATLVATTVTSTVDEFQRVVGVAYGPDGRLLVLSGTATKGPGGTELERFDAAVPTSVFSSRSDDQAQGLILGHGKLFVADRWPQVRVFDLSTPSPTQLDTDGDGDNGVTPMTLDDPIRPHGVAAVTPF